MTILQHPSLGGDGSVPCPGELVAMALAGCMDGTVRLFADLMEIQVDRIRVEVVIRGDVRGLLGAKDIDAPADTGITMTVNVEARDATDEQLAKLREISWAASGVLNMLRHQIPVALTWS